MLWFKILIIYLLTKHQPNPSKEKKKLPSHHVFFTLLISLVLSEAGYENLWISLGHMTIWNDWKCFHLPWDYIVNNRHPSTCVGLLWTFQQHEQYKALLSHWGGESQASETPGSMLPVCSLWWHLLKANQVNLRQFKVLEYGRNPE